ncbi:YicC/YloC family endoribonuclease [Gilvimarinus sp. F26214L]|uniref:YicC/YloC family endoribonuclease n=1 Tax=Gilvimarinus sp. DZF01 TaxID=3461371 RepID=UPI004045CA4A
MVRSMTGFARKEAVHPWGTLAWEIRSVNHRYLEPHFRLPEALRAIEPELRNRLRKAVHRGKVELGLYLNLEEGRNEAIKVNMETVEKLAQAIRQVNAVVDSAAPVNALDLLRWPGVLNSSALDNEVLQDAALELFDESLKQLSAHREREGAELAQLIEQRLVSVSDEADKVREQLPAIMQAQRDKLLERLAAAKEEVNPERLEQELLFYAHKSDVAEELDRLVTHVAEVRHTLKQKGAIGRRLDFLMQELNREANTLSSKSSATDTTQSAIELKILIEQMREQIQNIE